MHTLPPPALEAAVPETEDHHENGDTFLTESKQTAPHEKVNLTDQKVDPYGISVM